MIEAAAEEMIAYQMAQDVRPSDKAKTGISYKEKLAQRRNKVAGKSPASQPPAVQAVPPVPPKAEEAPAPPKVQETPPPPKVEEPVITTREPEPVAQVEIPQSPTPVQVTQPPAPSPN